MGRFQKILERHGDSLQKFGNCGRCSECRLREMFGRPECKRCTPRPHLH